MSLRDFLKTRYIEMHFLRRDALGGKALSSGYIVLDPRDEDTSSTSLRFYFKGLGEDAVLGRMDGWCEYFQGSPAVWINEYIRLHGYNANKNVVMDAILYPLAVDMHGEVHEGFHLDGFYGYRQTKNITLKNLPEPYSLDYYLDAHYEPRTLSEDYEGEVITPGKGKKAPGRSIKINNGSMMALDGGPDCIDPDDTVLGSSWKPGN